MKYTLEEDTVRKLALDLMREVSPWEYGNAEGDKIEFIKLTMYNAGIMDMAAKIISAIEELKKL